MIKKLTKRGDGLALVMDHGMLDLLEIDAETPLNIKTDGKCLISDKPLLDSARHKRFRAALAEGNRRYGRTFKKLRRVIIFHNLVRLVPCCSSFLLFCHLLFVRPTGDPNQ